MAYRKNHKKTRKMRTKTRKTRRVRKTTRFVGGFQETKFASPLVVNQVRY